MGNTAYPNDPVIQSPTPSGLNVPDQPLPVEAVPSDPVEAFFTGNEAAQPQGVPEAPPDVVAGETPAQAVAPTAPQAPAPTAAPVPEQDNLDQLLDENLSSYIDPDLLASLKKQAKGESSIGEIFALAGLAAVNPQMAQGLMQGRLQSAENARTTLANLQQQAGAFKRAVLSQAEISKRADARIQQAAEGQLRTSRDQQAKILMAEASDARIDIGPAPADYLDDTAFQAWSDNAVKLIAGQGYEREQKAARLKLAQEIFPDLLKFVNMGPAPDQILGAALARVRLAGDTETTAENFEERYPGLIGSLQSAAIQSRKLQDAKASKLTADDSIAEAKIAQGWAQLELAEERLRLNDSSNALRYISQNEQLVLGLEKQAIDYERLATLYEEDYPDTAIKYSEAAQNRMEAAGKLRSSMTSMFERAKSYSAELDPRQGFQKAYYTEFEARFGEFNPEGQAWLHANKTDPKVKAFWDGVLARLTIGKSPAEFEGMVQYIEETAYGKFSGYSDIVPLQETGAAERLTTAREQGQPFGQIPGQPEVGKPPQ